jgi:thiamine biosynthesis protein ThiC
LQHLFRKQNLPLWTSYSELVDLLQKYKRVISLNPGIIIRDDTPDLLKIVPENKIGLFNESPFINRLY